MQFESRSPQIDVMREQFENKYKAREKNVDQETKKYLQQ